ncbi:hypothetical protein D0Z00_004510 [Geotrichum galactomycetum]|uniref:Uncharacterized protein n=1 Tax=Geotrichum galactomycetum TaxID=27317 RepID=A0ACB6UY92_9ASCO|nr:hypothetical protein D0Z00_004510 [Geotrichum candidum]
MANRLENVLLDLIDAAVPNTGAERAARLQLQCQQIIKKHQYQYPAIHIGTVYEQYDALVERIGVLSIYGPKFTARLEEIVETELNHDDYVTAQMLVLLKELSVHPERQQPRNTGPETLEDLRREEGGGNEEDIFANLFENTLVINQDSDDSTLSDWSEDEDAAAPASPARSLSISPRPGDIFRQRAQRERQMGQTELRLFLKAVEGDEHQQPDLSGAAVDADVQRFRNFSYWNMDGTGLQPVVVAEATLVHELLVALHGLPSILFGVGGIANRLRVLHLSVETVQKLVAAANAELAKLQKIREFLDIEKSFLGLQVFDDAIERLMLKGDLHQFTKAIELELFTNNKNGNNDDPQKNELLFSLNRVLRKLQAFTKDWHFVIQVIETIDEVISIDNNEYHCFIFVLQELYDALKIVFLTADNNPAFNRTLQVFKACFDFFSIEKLGPWFQRGQRHGVEFIELDREAEFGVKLNDLLLPKFLVKFKSTIFEIGLSRKLLQKAGPVKDGLEYIYDLPPEIDEGKDKLYEIVFTIHDPNIFWLEFDGNLEKWIYKVHASTTSSLIIKPELDFFRVEVLDWYFLGLLLPPSASTGGANYDAAHLLVLQDFRTELFAKLVRVDETVDKFQVFDAFKNCLKRNGVVAQFDALEVSMKANSNKYQTRLQVLEKLTLRVRHQSTEYVLTKLFLSATAVAKYNEVWSELMKVSYILYFQTRQASHRTSTDLHSALPSYHQTIFYYKLLEYYMFVINEQYKRFRRACTAQNARPVTTLFTVLNSHQQFLTAVSNLLFLNAEQSPLRTLLNEIYAYTLTVAAPVTNDEYTISAEYFEDHFIARFKTTLALFIYDTNDDDNLLNFLHKRLD